MNKDKDRNNGKKRKRPYAESPSVWSEDEEEEEECEGGEDDGSSSVDDNSEEEKAKSRVMHKKSKRTKVNRERFLQEDQRGEEIDGNDDGFIGF